jgi:hypothetical protein
LELTAVAQEPRRVASVRPRIRPSLSVPRSPIPFGRIARDARPERVKISAGDIGFLLAEYFPVLVVHRGHIVRFINDHFELYRPSSKDRLIDSQIQNLFGRCYSRLSFFGLERVIPTCCNLCVVAIIAESSLSAHVADFLLRTRFAGTAVPGIYVALSQFAEQAYLVVYFGEAQRTALEAAVLLHIGRIFVIAESLADAGDLGDSLHNEAVRVVGFSDAPICAGGGMTALLRDGSNWEGALADQKFGPIVEVPRGLAQAKAVIALTLTRQELRDLPEEVVMHRQWFGSVL